MTLRVIVAGVTGWTGSAVARGIMAADDMTLVGAVSRAAAGRDAGEAAGGSAAGVTVSASLAEALRTPCDIVVDYTKPHVVKGHALEADRGRRCGGDRHVGPHRRGLRRDRGRRQGEGHRGVRVGQLLDHGDADDEVRADGRPLRADVEVIDYALRQQA